jgi:hypothetical protein
MPKTDAEIQAEWKALPEFKKQVPHYDRYRVDQWMMIDAQIETLRDGFNLAQIKKRWNTDDEGDCRGAAEDALYWKQGGKVFSPVQFWRMGIVSYLKLQKPPKTRGVVKALQAPRVLETV